MAQSEFISVSDGCPNTWHNASRYREARPCPECPSQPGLRLALSRLESLIRVREDGGDDAGVLHDAAQEIEALIYSPTR